ncbi:MAG TPA: DcaP family trimeric outer membrane transporter [Terriglobia bacterium]|nr:DcaP family trimeric outer membrane transporter [Terriglobia bacterium]
MAPRIIRNCAMPIALCLLFAAAAAGQAPAPAPPPSRLDIYGFVMTDFIYDERTNDPDWFDVNRPTKLPAFAGEFGRDGHTWAGVRQTRFGVKSYQATSMGELRTHFEFDFFGVGPDAGQTTIRPRYFYGELGHFGAGQTVSPFMDVDVFPNILDYWGPNGMVFFRNVQLRWMPIQGESFLTLALERPGSTQDPGVLAQRVEIADVFARYPLPDLSGEYRWGGERGYIEGAGIVRKIVLDDAVSDAFNLDDSIIGWGVNISSNVYFREKKDILRLEYTFGDGIENYMNDAPADVAAIPNPGDPVRPIKGKALPLRSLVAFLDHSWNDRLTTSVGYSELAIDNTVLQLPSAFHRGQYAIVNLLWQPIDHLMYGGELQWGRRTNFGDGFHSNDYRVQFGFRYNFSGELALP